MTMPNTLSTNKLDELARAITEYCAEQDKEAWCMRLKHGQCSSRKCNIEGGWTVGSPPDFSRATCARYRVEQALRTGASQPGADKPGTEAGHAD